MLHIGSGPRVCQLRTLGPWWAPPLHFTHRPSRNDRVMISHTSPASHACFPTPLPTPQSNTRVADLEAALKLELDAEEYAAASATLLLLKQARLESAAAREAAEGAMRRTLRWGAYAHGVGAVVTHRRYGYRGVVAGMDPTCLASPAWMAAMRVDALSQGRFQPFYHVLVDERDRPGGVTTYVAEVGRAGGAVGWGREVCREFPPSHARGSGRSALQNCAVPHNACRHPPVTPTTPGTLYSLDRRRTWWPLGGSGRSCTPSWTSCSSACPKKGCTTPA